MDNWERALIGTVLYDPKCLPDEIRPEDFASKPHQLIWSAALELAQRNTLSPRATVELLRSRDELESIGDGVSIGEDYIFELVKDADITVVDEFSSQVIERSDKRKLEGFFREMVMKARNGLTPAELIDMSLHKLLTMQRSGVREARRIGLDFNDETTRWDKVRKGEYTLPWEPKTQAVKDLIMTADEADFIIVVARPGSGKSSYLRHEAIETASLGQGVLTITLENTRREALIWAIAKHTKINSMKLKGPRLLSQKELERAKEARAWIESLPWYVEDIGFSDIGNIISLSRKMAIKHDLRLIQVDGMYLVEMNNQGKYEVVSGVAQGLRSLANELKVPIMASTQFSRKASTKDTPGIEDLLYAGENPARQIWALVPNSFSSRDAMRFQENRQEDGKLITNPANYGAVILNFHVLKNTGGRTGKTTDIAWIKATNEFRTLEKGWNLKP